MRIHVFAGAGQGVGTHEVGPQARLADVLTVEDDEKVYVVDEDDALDLGIPLEEALDGRAGHLAVSSCHRVEVTVGYAGRDERIRVSPAARLRRVRKRAIEQLGIGPAEAADLVLRLPGETEDLDLSAPVSSVVARRTCSVTLDLLHTVRPQG